MSMKIATLIRCIPAYTVKSQGPVARNAVLWQPAAKSHEKGGPDRPLPLMHHRGCMGGQIYNRVAKLGRIRNARATADYEENNSWTLH